MIATSVICLGLLTMHLADAEPDITNRLAAEALF
jgi:hypothetical protein